MDIQQKERDKLLELVENYLEGNATDQEVKFLINYYESFQGNDEWLEALSSDKLLEERMLLRLQKSLSNNKSIEKKPVNFFRLNILKYAAIFIGIIGVGYFFMNNNGESVEQKLIIPNEEITLHLENGSIKTISPVEDKSKEILNSKGELISVQEKGSLLYKNNVKSEKLAYNKLVVPLGKQFEVVLSDGTTVKLNAGTSFKYPVKFIDGNDRMVYLKGEAYFDVAKDVNHPFIVNTSDVNVQVLGTQFNVSSYSDDDQINTVLVEGSVSVSKIDEKYQEEKPSVIKPGFKAVWNKNQENITISKANTQIHTAWINGKLILKNTSFRIIRKKLERQYNVTIINNNSLLDEEKFNINFDAENIQQVLKTLNESFEIEYEIINNQIIIN